MTRGGDARGGRLRTDAAGRCPGPATVATAYERLVCELRQQADLAAALRLLEWDQETYLPAGALSGRARQIGTLAALLHQRRTAPWFLALVDELAAAAPALDPGRAVDVRETKWRLDRCRRVDGALVRERAMLHAEARAVWRVARQTDDFTALAPYLSRVIDAGRRVAAAVDGARAPYDVLLEAYEPGMSTAALSALFDDLREGLLPLMDRLRAWCTAGRAERAALRGEFPVRRQRRFNRLVAARLGFAFDRGRLDEAAHPFTTAIGGDVRITTRYDRGDLRYGLYSTLHEVGHGLYEQGLDPATWGLPRGQACSLGMHESQARLWENHVGRSAAFWRVFLPVAQRMFPSLAGTPLEAVVRAVNDAGPSLIRTEADEISYNLHVLMRFELEQALVAGTLRVPDLPAAWRAASAEYLGVVPRTDRDGVLQDVHWASGALAYFPTYALGNVYAAQLMVAAEAALGPLEQMLGDGDSRVLLEWLRARVHRAGRSLRAPALIATVTGAPPSAAHLLRRAEEKVALLESA